MNQRQLSEQGYELAARKFKILADPGRLQILDLLRRDGPMTVTEVQEALEVSQPTASRQLSRLHKEGFLERARRDNTVIYSLEDLSVFELCDVMCGRLERESDRAQVFVEVAAP